MRNELRYYKPTDLKHEKPNRPKQLNLRNAQ